MGTGVGRGKSRRTVVQRKNRIDTKNTIINLKGARTKSFNGSARTSLTEKFSFPELLGFRIS